MFRQGSCGMASNCPRDKVQSADDEVSVWKQQSVTGN